MITINWATKLINVPQSYLSNLGGGLYELDVNQFRLDLKDLEDNEDGMIFPKTHNHNPTVLLSGVLYARSIEIVNGYTVEFESGTYSVKCIGANHNLGDVKVVNPVSLIIGNSAGMIVSGSGVTPQDKLDIADAVLDELMSGHTMSGSFAEELRKKLSQNNFLALK